MLAVKNFAVVPDFRPELTTSPTATLGPPTEPVVSTSTRRRGRATRRRSQRRTVNRTAAELANIRMDVPFWDVVRDEGATCARGGMLTPRG